MAKISISSLLSSFTSVAKLNENFQALVDELNNKVLYRDNPGTEPNAMSNDLDMSNNDISNVGVLSADEITVVGEPTGLVGLRDEAATSATAAATSESNAATSETNASTSETNALDSANDANKWATEAEDVQVDDGVNPVGFSAFHWSEKAAAASGGDTVKISPNDTTAAELVSKITASSPIVVTEINDGGNEILNITKPFRGALVSDTSGTAISDDVATALPFDTEAYDTDTIHDNATNNTRLTVPSGVTKVRVSGNFEAIYTASSVDIWVTIRKNGSFTYVGVPYYTSSIDSSTFHAANISSPPLEVTAGDYFEMWVTVDSNGGSPTLTADGTWLAMEIIE